MAKPVTGKLGHELGRTTPACTVTAIVSCVVAAEADGVTVVGLNEQVAFAGSPEHAKEIAEFMPPHGVIVRIVFPTRPGWTVTTVGETAMEKLGRMAVMLRFHYAAGQTRKFRMPGRKAGTKCSRCKTRREPEAGVTGTLSPLGPDLEGHQ
jgi:hypothetical protein